MVQKGVTTSSRVNSRVSAGRVLVLVAAVWVERKSVSCTIGAIRTLHLAVKMPSVSTISSRLLFCLIKAP